MISNLFITDHAKKRAAQRFNRSKKIENLIRNIVVRGKEVFPKDRMHYLLKYGFKECEFYLHDNKIAVVENKRIITVYYYDKRHFH